MRILRRSLAAAPLALAAFAAPAQASIFGPPQGHSPNANDIRTTYWVMLIVIAISAVVAIVALIMAATRFKERREEPRRLSAGRGAITRVGIGLGVITLIIFIFGIVMTDKVRKIEPSGPNGLQASAATFAQVGADGVPPVTEAEVQDAEDAAGKDTNAAQAPNVAGPLQIQAVGQQWLWRFEYPGGRQGQRVFSYGELVVPLDTTVVLNITSTDVIHSWFVPALGGQVDAVPGLVSQTWFKADRTGVFHGNSTIFSGTNYPAMRADVRVVTPTEYQDYLDNQERDLTSAQKAILKAQQAAPAGGVAQP
ncbi:hypothetical protein BH10ACT11_BH10ACT11_06920 [soil metagenome]